MPATSGNDGPARKAAKPAATEEARLHRLDARVITVPIESLSSLICHAWSDKAKKMMLDKQTKAARTAKAAKNPEEDYRASLYLIEEDVYGFPGIAFKKAMVRAAQYADAKMVFLRGAVFVLGDLVRIDGKPQMREDMVRLPGGVADLRYRAEFPEWRADLKIQYNDKALSAEQIINYLSIAGFSVGVGEWRPEKDGEHGRFKVVAG
jgi:hypothetical protein